jgi:alpha/beta superfamily hydrolase
VTGVARQRGEDRLHVDLAGPAGRLEALWEEPPSPRAAAVVCHPHPLHGGTMHTHAVHRIARAARSSGVSTLRFQFRGVGLSAGSHDGGRGERDDVRAALSWTAARRPGKPLLLAGFSFGAGMAVAVGCEEPRVAGLLVAGLADRASGDAARACGKPLASIQAEGDEFQTPADVAALLRGSEHPRRTATVHGTSHLFTEGLDRLEREAAAAFEWLLEAR